MRVGVDRHLHRRGGTTSALMRPRLMPPLGRARTPASRRISRTVHRHILPGRSEADPVELAQHITMKLISTIETSLNCVSMPFGQDLVHLVRHFLHRRLDACVVLRHAVHERVVRVVRCGLLAVLMTLTPLTPTVRTRSFAASPILAYTGPVTRGSGPSRKRRERGGGDDVVRHHLRVTLSALHDAEIEPPRRAGAGGRLRCCRNS